MKRWPPPFGSPIPDTLVIIPIGTWILKGVTSPDFINTPFVIFIII
jgi:hypothetical protein